MQKWSEKFAAPLKKIIDAIHQRGCKRVIRICGNSLPVIESMTGAGADIIGVDQKVDIVSAKDAVLSRSTIRGNLDPSVVMQRGSPEQVLESARECIAKAKNGGHFFLAPGCTVGYNTPPENIHMLKQAIEMYGRY